SALSPGDPGRFAQALAAQVHWLASARIQSATLKLSPEHLGPLQVRIDLTSSHVNVSFSAHHSDTRAALVEALPQLRTLLAAGGLALGQATVQQESHSDRSAGGSAGEALKHSGPIQSVEPITVSTRVALGLIDEYA